MNLYMSFGARACTFMLGIYLGVKLLTHRMCICSAFVDTAKQFSEAVKLIQTPTTIYVSSSVPNPGEAEHFAHKI